MKLRPHVILRAQLTDVAGKGCNLAVKDSSDAYGIRRQA
jgi:hypothetical protein